MIQAEGLSKEYALYQAPSDRLKEALHLTGKKLHTDFFALKNVSFDVKKGETVGIIGTNGAGKSTLLKIITGVTAATGGHLTVRGKISALLELGAGFHPEYTGLENIYLNGAMMGCTRKEMESRVEEICRFAEIGDFIHQPVKTYSSGMFARLAFSVAIHVEPDILIVDEALSVGDIFFQNKCFRKFEELRRRGVTILFVSHDLESVKQMCSRVLWLEHGEQQMFGDRLEVCSAYARSLLQKSNAEGFSQENWNPEQYRVEAFRMEKYPAVTGRPESLLNDKVKILSCFFEDSGGKIVYDLRGGEFYRFVIIFRSEIDLEHGIAGFVLQNRKGVAVINTNTLIAGEKKNFAVKAGSTTRVEFLMQFPKLTANEYLVDCAVADGRSVMENTMYTWLYGALRIMVTNPDAGLAMIDVDADVRILSDREEA